MTSRPAWLAVVTELEALRGEPLETCGDNHGHPQDAQPAARASHCSDAAGNAWSAWSNREGEQGSASRTATLDETATPPSVVWRDVTFEQLLIFGREHLQDDEAVECVYTTDGPDLSKKLECTFKSTGKPAVVAT